MKSADQKYILRFERPGHRERLKQQAVAEKRSLNRQLLILLEAGERSLYPRQPTQEGTAAMTQRHQATKGEGLTAPTVSPSIENRSAPTEQIPRSSPSKEES